MRRLAMIAVAVSAPSLLASCLSMPFSSLPFSSDGPSEARREACRVAYVEEVRQADAKYMEDAEAFRKLFELDNVPATLSIRIQDSFNNNLKYVKVRASVKLENCLKTGVYDAPAR